MSEYPFDFGKCLSGGGYLLLRHENTDSVLHSLLARTPYTHLLIRPPPIVNHKWPSSSMPLPVSFRTVSPSFSSSSPPMDNSCDCYLINLFGPPIAYIASLDVLSDPCVSEISYQSLKRYVSLPHGTLTKYLRAQGFEVGNRVSKISQTITTYTSSTDKAGNTVKGKKREPAQTQYYSMRALNRFLIETVVTYYSNDERERERAERMKDDVEDIGKEVWGEIATLKTVCDPSSIESEVRQMLQYLESINRSRIFDLDETHMRAEEPGGEEKEITARDKVGRVNKELHIPRLWSPLNTLDPHEEIIGTSDPENMTEHNQQTAPNRRSRISSEILTRRSRISSEILTQRAASILSRNSDVVFWKRVTPNIIELLKQRLTLSASKLEERETEGEERETEGEVEERGREQSREEKKGRENGDRAQDKKGSETSDSDSDNDNDADLDIELDIDDRVELEVGRRQVEVMDRQIQELSELAEARLCQMIEYKSELEECHQIIAELSRELNMVKIQREKDISSINMILDKRVIEKQNLQRKLSYWEGVGRSLSGGVCSPIEAVETPKESPRLFSRNKSSRGEIEAPASDDKLNSTNTSLVVISQHSDPKQIQKDLSLDVLFEILERILSDVLEGQAPYVDGTQLYLAYNNLVSSFVSPALSNLRISPGSERLRGHSNAIICFEPISTSSSITDTSTTPGDDSYRDYHKGDDTKSEENMEIDGNNNAKQITYGELLDSESILRIPLPDQTEYILSIDHPIIDPRLTREQLICVILQLEKLKPHNPILDHFRSNLITALLKCEK